MSGISILEKRPTASVDWMLGDTTDMLVEEMTKEYLATSASPVTVDDDGFEIDSNLLEVGKVYTFEFLDSQMVLWKQPNGDIDLYELIEK
jgi:hypothetical protein